MVLRHFVAVRLTALAVAFAFRCGMFNIGGQGQYLVGAILGVFPGGPALFANSVDFKVGVKKLSAHDLVEYDVRETPEGTSAANIRLLNR